jgi:hypothetical protein
VPEPTTKTAPAPQKDLFGNVGPLPAEIREEERESRHIIKPTGAGGLTIDQLLEDPKKGQAILETRARLLQQLQSAAIARTKPTDWTLYTDKDGHIVGVLRDSGAVNVRKVMGISIFNHRPNEGRIAEPRITEERIPALDFNGKETGELLTCHIAEMWADGICTLTGEEAPDVYCGLRSIDAYNKPQFVGRGHVQDLKASCRTTLDTKVVRILSGLRKVDAQVLKEHGIDLDRCYKGSGFGNAEARQAGKVAEEGVADQVAKLKEELLRVTGGEASAVRQLTIEITRNEAKGFKGFDNVERLTKSWQIDQAWKALKAHPQFGDDHAAEKKA